MGFLNRAAKDNIFFWDVKLSAFRNVKNTVISSKRRELNTHQLSVTSQKNSNFIIKRIRFRAVYN